MSRELKFRAWDRINKNWWKALAMSDILNPIFPDQIELMQFTGLTDKNGTEIYEGDIIKNYHQLFVVQWYGMEARLMPFTTTAVDEGNHIASAGVPIRDWNWIQCVDTTDPDWRNKPHKYGTGINFHDSNFGRPEACEVIGNIYENPELLKRDME